MNKKIWIKTNGNGTIATGHVRRCITIASELQKKGADIKFLISDSESEKVLKLIFSEENREFDYMVMNTLPSEPNEDIPVIALLLSKDCPDFILVDSYFVTGEYIEALKEVASRCPVNFKVGYIDDFNKMKCPLDLAINYNVSADPEESQATVKLFGAEYAPLRKEFYNVDYEVKDMATTVFLSSGGTDPYGLIINILTEIYEGNSPYRKVLDFTGLKCHVVMGTLFSDDYKSELHEFAKRHDSVTLYEGVDNMAEVMKQCDFAVSAGGNTLYELCAVGVPTVVFCMADSQREFVKSFDIAGAAKYAGDVREDHRLVQKIVTWGTAAIDNKGFRLRMSQKARSVVDGKGAERIADAIIKMI